MKGKVRFEEQRAWDAKHPDNAIGDYTADRTIIHEDGSVEIMSAAEFAIKEEQDYEKVLESLGETVQHKVDEAKAGAAVAAGEAVANAEDIVEKIESGIDEAQADVEAAAEDIDESKGGQE